MWYNGFIRCSYICISYRPAMKIYFIWLLLLTILICLISGCIDKEVSLQESYIDTEYRTEYNLEKKLVTEQQVEPVSGKEYIEPIKSWNHDNIFWQVTQRSTSVLYYNTIDNVWYYGFNIPDHKSSKVIIDIHTPANMSGPKVMVFDFTNMDHIEACQSSIPKISFNPGKESSLDFDGQYKIWYEKLMNIIDNAEEIPDISKTLNTNEVQSQYKYDVTGTKSIAIICVNAQYAWSPIIKTTLYWEDEKITETEVMKEVEVPYQIPYEVEKQRTVTKVVKVPFWESLFNK
jgi:hypothetical protein